MFDFGLGSFELLMIAVVAIIVVGPKDLPKLLRAVGQFTTKIRGLAREFQGYLDEAARETGLDDVKNEVSKMTNFTVTDPATKPGTPKPDATSGSAAAGAAKTDTAAAKAEEKPAAKQPAKKKPAAKKTATKKATKKATAKAPAKSKAEA